MLEKKLSNDKSLEVNVAISRKNLLHQYLTRKTELTKNLKTDSVPCMHCIRHYKGQKWNIAIDLSWSDATLLFTYSNINATPWSSKTGLFIARTHNNFTGTTQRIQMDFIDFPNWVPRLFLTKCATKYIKL